MNSAMDIDHLRSWVGRTMSATDAIDLRPVRALAATLDRSPDSLAQGQALPNAWHWLFFHDVQRQSDLGRDGHPAVGGFLPPVTLPRRMWAGGRLEIGHPLTIGETVTKTSTILSVDAKAGRSGALVFVTVRHDFQGDRGGAMVEEHDIVYRDIPGEGDAKPDPKTPREEPQWTQTHTPTSVQLFRYSALTFNGHRIHYDLDFCRKEEGYDGLVVHGPLIATNLLGLVHDNLPDRTVSRFEFKAISPLFDTAPYSICGRADDDQATMWATNMGGELAMTAKAELRDA